MKTATAPENAMAESRNVRLSAGLMDSVSTPHPVDGRKLMNKSQHSQVADEACPTPILYDEGKAEQYGDGQEVVVKHRVPVFEPGGLDALPHEQDLYRCQLKGKGRLGAR